MRLGAHGCCSLSGFSGSGHLLGVMPALLLPSWKAAGGYLSAFCIGTMVAMSLFTATVGELSVSLGERTNRPDLPIMLAQLSSKFAIFMGVLWIMTSMYHVRQGAMAEPSAR